MFSHSFSCAVWTRIRPKNATARREEMKLDSIITFYRLVKKRPAHLLFHKMEARKPLQRFYKMSHSSKEFICDRARIDDRRCTDMKR